MPEIRVTVAELPLRIGAGHRERLAKAERAVLTAVKLHGRRLAQEEIHAAKPVPVDRGTYKRSWDVSPIKGGAALYNFAPHAPIIEHGRRPGARMPPLVPITAWVFRKGLVKGGRGSFVSESRYREARSIAFLIARAIARRGMKAHRILEKVNRRLAPLVVAAVREALK